MDEPQVFHKRPVTTEAMLYTGENGDAISRWVGFMSAYVHPHIAGMMIIETPNGPVDLREGEWVVEDIRGRFYPCDAEVFAASYADGKGREYPYEDGDFTTLGPQVFVGTREDGVRVINWKGENFEEQERIAKLQEALGLARSMIRSGESMSPQAEEMFDAAHGTKIGNAA